MEFKRCAFAGISEEEELFLFFPKPVHKFLDTRQKLGTLVNDTIHIADKATFGTNDFKISHIDPPL